MKWYVSSSSDESFSAVDFDAVFLPFALFIFLSEAASQVFLETEYKEARLSAGLEVHQVSPHLNDRFIYLAKEL
jgi:hypothetical protein